MHKYDSIFAPVEASPLYVHPRQLDRRRTEETFPRAEKTLSLMEWFIDNMKVIIRRLPKIQRFLFLFVYFFGN